MTMQGSRDVPLWEPQGKEFSLTTPDLALVAADALKMDSNRQSFKAMVRNSKIANIVAEALAMNATLQSVSLRGGGLSDETVPALARCLGSIKVLHSCHLSGNMGCASIVAVAQSLRSNNQLQTLSFESSSVEADQAVAIDALADLVQMNTALRHLHVEVRLREVSALTSALKNNTTLQYVSLKSCSGDAAGIALAEVLKLNVIMQYFALVVNDMSDAAGVALAHGLHVNSTLRSFSLSIEEWHGRAAPISMTDVTGMAFAEALRVNGVLHLFALSWSVDLVDSDIDADEVNNPTGSIGDPTGIALAQALQVNTALRSFSLDLPDEYDIEVTATMGDLAGAALAQALQVNTVLQSFSLSAARMGDDTGVMLADALETNTSLREFSLENTCMGNGAALAFAKALQANSTLKSFSLF